MADWKKAAYIFLFIFIVTLYSIFAVGGRDENVNQPIGEALSTFFVIPVLPVEVLIRSIVHLEYQGGTIDSFSTLKFWYLGLIILFGVLYSIIILFAFSKIFGKQDFKLLLKIGILSFFIMISGVFIVNRNLAGLTLNDWAKTGGFSYCGRINPIETTEPGVKVLCMLDTLNLLAGNIKTSCEIKRLVFPFEKVDDSNSACLMNDYISQKHTLTQNPAGYPQAIKYLQDKSYEEINKYPDLYSRGACSFFGDKDNRDKCFERIARYKKDPADCEAISRLEGRDSCRKYVNENMGI